MDALKRRILALREQQVTAGGRAFTVRRMGDLPLARLRERHRSDTSAFLVDLVRESVVGWDMDEAGLFAGGGDSAVTFDSDLFMTWIEDQPTVFDELATAVVEILNRHREHRAASAKN